MSAHQKSDIKEIHIHLVAEEHCCFAGNMIAVLSF